MKSSKIDRVRKHLEKGLSLTPRQAVAKFDYWRLSDAAYKLKRRGLNVVCEIVTTKTSTHGKYFIPKV